MNFKKRVNGSWVDTPNYIHNTSTDTITTLPAVIYPTGTTATVGLKGQTTQSSTPSPTSPVMPQGTGERTGNLLDESASSDADATHINYNKNAPIILTAGQTYTFSCDTVCNGLYIRSVVDDSTLASANNSSSLTYTPLTNVSVYCRVWNSNGITNLKPMLNTGSTALPYEPYGYKIPISSANTTTPVYLGKVQTTRKIKKYECTGEENWQFYSDSVGTYGAWQFYANNIATGLALSSAQSNIANYGVTATTRHLNPYGVYLVTSGTGIAFQMAGAKDTFPKVTAWKSYLAAQYANGTPVTVWYVLATEETAVVNEPLMRIGEYADSLSTTIPVTAGENTLDVQTTVQPSEVTAGFSGWHPIAEVHERENSQWD